MQASSAGRVKVLRATQQAIKKRERGEKRREEKRERERHTQKQRGTLGVVSRIFFGETKELETKREKQRERERVRERELERKPPRPKRASEYSSSVEEDLHAERRRHFWILKLFPLVLLVF